MRFSVVATLALFAASAQASINPSSLLRRQSLPSCANDCIANPNLGACTTVSDDCLCRDNTFVTTTFACIQAACKGQDLATAIADAAALCAAVHVTLVSAAGAEFSATASLASTGSPTASDAAAQTSAPPDATSSTPAPSTTTTNGASPRAASSALLVLGAIGAIALAL
ncbi:hypothetical protein FB451DRAFT_128641 [Mycena latifolia]|nr:hypothetical protein FB451DRAFT_128641 [Mycena latifolia]